MKCRSCAKEYPSRHYFEIADICIDCASRLAPEEKTRVIQEMQKIAAGWGFTDGWLGVPADIIRDKHGSTYEECLIRDGGLAGVGD